MDTHLRLSEGPDLDNLPTHLPHEPDKQPPKESTPKPSMPIPGTGITLETEEDIQKWIAERRRNYPTNKRILEKRKQKQVQPEVSKKQKTLLVKPGAVGKKTEVLPGVVATVPVRFTLFAAKEERLLSMRVANRSREQIHKSLLQFVREIAPALSDDAIDAVVGGVECQP